MSNPLIPVTSSGAQAIARTASVVRQTNETAIEVKLNLDGTGQSNLSTGIGFFDHMLDQIARHGLIDLDIQAKGEIGRASCRERVCQYV